MFLITECSHQEKLEKLQDELSQFVQFHDVHGTQCVDAMELYKALVDLCKHLSFEKWLKTFITRSLLSRVNIDYWFDQENDTYMLSIDLVSRFVYVTKGVN